MELGLLEFLENVLNFPKKFQNFKKVKKIGVLRGMGEREHKTMTGNDGEGTCRAKNIKKTRFFKREKVEEGRVLKFLNIF